VSELGNIPCFDFISKEPLVFRRLVGEESDIVEAKVSLILAMPVNELPGPSRGRDFH
jgi:hypothetical protein